MSNTISLSWELGYTALHSELSVHHRGGICTARSVIPGPVIRSGWSYTGVGFNGWLKFNCTGILLFIFIIYIYIRELSWKHDASMSTLSHQ